jgi:hypothetical protein
MLPYLLAVVGGYLIGDSNDGFIKGNNPKMADGGMMAKGGFFGLFSKNKLRVGDILLINPYNLPPMLRGSQYFRVLPSTKLRVEKITNDRYYIRRMGIDDDVDDDVSGDGYRRYVSTDNLNQYDREDIDTFLKEGRLIKEGGKIKYAIVDEDTDRIYIIDTDKSFIDKKYRELKEIYPNDKLSIIEFPNAADY